MIPDKRTVQIITKVHPTFFTICGRKKVNKEVDGYKFALREEFEQDSLTSKKKRLILTIAAGASEKVITDSYNVTEIVKYVDFINVMTYDYFGEWSKLTGFTSPLYSRHSNRKFNPTLSQDNFFIIITN
ncbi:hypothetical protein KUTeg_001789 [Tegillarca granosa]|uniref:GH18 domain-containing protein n=1 Tax=Tegillarca granosa TaxID=220873 RepID=A0ABQ9FW43_TEGGR|nr:hypothetical protein KUTeg_001789 [Tegillarca granosa]